MKKLLLMLATVGMIFTACEGNGGIEEGNGQKDPTEQPGNGENGGKDDVEIPADKTQAIKFQDEATKLLCTLHWDENEDGELSYEEAAAITDLYTAFKGSSIMAFTELKYFTGLAEIADNAFEGCVSLVKITLPEQITTIGISAFIGCTNLKKIEIPDSVTSIDSESFRLCPALTEIHFRSTTPPTLATNTFDINSEADKNPKIYIPHGSYAAYLACEWRNEYKKWIVEDENFEFADTYIIEYTTSDGKPISKNFGTGLHSNTYENDKGTLIFYNEITVITDQMFESCSSLTSITIPDSVTSIGKSAFEGCSSLTTFYGKLASSDNRCLIIDGVLKSFAPAGLTSYTIPDSVTSIGEDAFRDCSSLTSITIPDSVTSIGKSAFSGCTGELIINSKIIGTDYTSNNYPANSNDGWLYGSNFTKLTIGNNITKIGSYAFYGCTGELIINSKIIETDYTSNNYPANSNYGWLYGSNFTKLTIGNNITKIGSYAFYGCSSLRSITIPDSVTEIGKSAFSGCTGELIINSNCLGLFGGQFTKLTIGDSVTSIGEYAFYWSSSLASVTIGNSVTEIGSDAFSYCSRLRSVTIPDSVTSIGSNAFHDCISLTSVTIPDSVTSIGEYAFSYCSSLTSVTIGNNVTSIGSSTFSNCSSLTSITIPDSVTSIGEHAFYDCI